MRGMALPALLRRKSGPARPVLEMTEGDTCERVVSFVDANATAIDLGATTTAEVVVYYGCPGDYTISATGTATIDGDGSTGLVTVSFTPEETADIGADIVWQPLQAVDEKTMVWRLTLTDGTDTATTHKGAVRVNRREV
jgi:hypothetical protein